jgi:hypothetical protein
MNIDVINLAQYEAPQIIESKQKGYVTFGENNSYFQFLIDRYRKSATINAPTIIDYGYYIGVQAVYSLKAGRFYIVQLYNLTNFLGSEQVWCYKAGLQTDEHSSNNDFVML